MALLLPVVLVTLQSSSHQHHSIRRKEEHRQDFANQSPMLSPGDLSSVPLRPKISHSPAPKGNESISEPQRIDRRRLEDEEDEDEDEEGMTSNLISMVRIGLDADFDDEDDEDEGLEVIRPLKCKQSSLPAAALSHMISTCKGPPWQPSLTIIAVPSPQPPH